MKIRTKMLAGFLGISLVPLGVVIAWAAFNAENNTVRQVLNQLDSVASNQESRARSIWSQNVERFALVASRTALRVNLENYTRDPRPEYQTRMNQILTDAKSSIASFRVLSVLMLDGKVVASTEATAIGANYSGVAFFVRGRTQSSADLFFYDPVQGLGVHISGPLLLNAILIGVLLIDSSIDGMVSSVKDYTGLGTSGETILVEKYATGDARFLTPARFDGLAALNRTVSATSATDPAIRAISGVEGLFPDSIDYRGQPVLSATRYVDETGWGVIVKIDRAEALTAVGQLGFTLLLFLLAYSAPVAVASLIVSRSFTKPIVSLAETSRKIAAGQRSERAVVSSHDEVATLAEDFNRMAEELVNANAVLEQRVRERTEQLERDIEARTLVEKELARSNAELEQFAYVASHDLQEPLRMVASYVQLLDRRYRGKLDSDADEFIGFAVDGASRMQRLINDLLAYARVGTRGRAFEPSSGDSLLEQAVANLRTAMEDSGAVVSHGLLPTVDVDPVQLVQVFQNLIGNAVRFRSDAPPRIHVSSANANGEWTFSVQDNGRGIDPKDFERLFQIFQPLEPRGKDQGTGIGLAICKRIVERHGGRIWVESQPNQGSTFYFTIPAR